MWLRLQVSPAGQYLLTPSPSNALSSYPGEASWCRKQSPSARL